MQLGHLFLGVGIKKKKKRRAKRHHLWKESCKENQGGKEEDEWDIRKSGIFISKEYSTALGFLAGQEITQEHTHLAWDFSDFFLFYSNYFVCPSFSSL